MQYLTLSCYIFHMLKAFIFDFDGVIVDTELLHLSAFQEILKDFHVSLAREEYYLKYLGMDDRDCFRTVLAEHNITFDTHMIDNLIQKKTEYFMENVKKGISTYPGVVEFIKKIQHNFPLAIASGALRHEIETILEGLDIRRAFRIIVSSEDVEKSKPDPEIFLRALQGLQEISKRPIRPEECAVIEDSVAGIAGARRAGMYVIGITNTYTAMDLRMAHIVIESLEDLDLERIGQITEKIRR